jgi:hypothetical protein
MERPAQLNRHRNEEAYIREFSYLERSEPVRERTRTWPFLRRPAVAVVRAIGVGLRIIPMAPNKRSPSAFDPTGKHLVAGQERFAVTSDRLHAFDVAPAECEPAGGSTGGAIRRRPGGVPPGLRRLPCV